jgi:hypothetical protein
MRGDYYLWSDGAEVLHIWVADGYDGWDEAIWATDEGGKRYEDRAKASGVGIPEKVMDEFVVMRLAQMVEEDLFEDAIDRAIENYGGNFGCTALSQAAEGLKAALRQVEFKKPQGNTVR